MKLTTASFLLFLATGSSFSQEKFTPIPEKDLPQYHLNFERLFFRTPAEEREGYAELQQMITRLEGYKGHLAQSGEILFNALLLEDSILVQQSLHDAYLYMRFAVNTADIESSNREGELSAEVNGRTQFLQNELMQLTDDDLVRLFREKPTLESYRFEIESARRDRAYTLPLAEEERLTKLSPFITDWQYEWYQHLLERIPFTTIPTTGGRSLNVWSDRGVIANDPDRKVREEGFKERFRDLSKERDMFALVLIKLVQAKNAYSQAHHFADFPDESYHARYLQAADVRNLLRRVEGYASVYKTFEKVRAEHVRQTSGDAEVQYWDIMPGGTGTFSPRFDIRDASDIILKTVRLLGAEYESEMADLLNPKNGRLDIVPGDHRLPGGGGVGFPGIPNVFYSEGYEGYYKDVSVLIHEGGHVVHFQLMGNNHVKAIYGGGPNYFSESFSIFNELLLADNLYHREDDPSKKVFYLEQFLDVKGLEIFKAAREAQLEQAIYDAVENGTVHNADDLDSLTLRVLSGYTIWSDKNLEQFKGTWMSTRLMYEDPLYLANYVYGGLLSLKYYEMYTKDPKTFVPRYLSMMRNGFDDEPAVLLKKFLDIDINDPNLLKDGMGLLEKKTSELKALYTAP